MNYTPIGRVRPIHRGAHDPSAAYGALDVVRREDGFASYMAKRDVPAGTPLADGAYWGLLSDVGLKAVADASCPWFEEGGSAAVCHPVAGYPLEVATLIAPKQSGAGEPSPDNVRPISGWTGAKLTRCGKNLLKNTASTYTTNGIAFTVNDDGTVTANGTSLARAQLRVGTVDLPAGSYIASIGFVSDVNATGTAFASYREGGVTKYVDMSGASEKSFTLTEPTTVTYMIDIRTAGITVSGLVFYPMIRPASVSDGAYEPFTGGTFTASFGQTVYGGTLNWLTGVLTVEWGYKALDGTESWGSAGSGTNNFYTAVNTLEKTNDFTLSMTCSTFRTFSTHSSLLTNAGISGYYDSNNNYPGENWIYLNNGVSTSTSELKEWLAAQAAAGTPVQVAYRLAAPTVIQLTPEQIAALAGMNVLFSDCGGTRAAGRSDMTWVTKGILDRLAALEAAAVSD